MWKCKKCGKEDAIMPRKIQALWINKDSDITSYKYEYAECEYCGQEEETIEELAEWIDES